jgi:hypothetical protein
MIAASEFPYDHQLREDSSTFSCLLFLCVSSGSKGERNVVSRKPWGTVWGKFTSGTCHSGHWGQQANVQPFLISNTVLSTMDTTVNHVHSDSAQTELVASERSLAKKINIKRIKQHVREIVLHRAGCDWSDREDTLHLVDQDQASLLTFKLKIECYKDSSPEKLRNIPG